MKHLQNGVAGLILKKQSIAEKRSSLKKGHVRLELPQAN